MIGNPSLTLACKLTGTNSRAVRSLWRRHSLKRRRSDARCTDDADVIPERLSGCFSEQTFCISPRGFLGVFFCGSEWAAQTADLRGAPLLVRRGGAASLHPEPFSVNQYKYVHFGHIVKILFHCSFTCVCYYLILIHYSCISCIISVIEIISYYYSLFYVLIMYYDL